MPDEAAAQIDADRRAAESVPEALIASCYGEMRSIARRILSGNHSSRILQPTELANESVIRLLRSGPKGIVNRGHLLATAARAMRQILIDEARKGSALKRQPLPIKTFLPDDPANRLIDIEAVDRALVDLAVHSPAHAEIVELRFMLGLSLAETVAATGVSQRTVTRRWQSARVWLLDHIDHCG
jgi:RNA polymerase sigma factor (TIGR02999 family)